MVIILGCDRDSFTRYDFVGSRVLVDSDLLYKNGLLIGSLAFVLRSAYCFIRNFAAASVSLMVLPSSGVLISGWVFLMLLLNNAVAGGSPVEL